MISKNENQIEIPLSSKSLVIKIQENKKGKIQVSIPSRKPQTVDNSHPLTISPMEIDPFESDEKTSMNFRKNIFPSHAIFLICEALEDSDLEFDMRGINPKNAGAPTLIFDVSGLKDQRYGEKTFLWPEHRQTISLYAKEKLIVFGTGFTIKFPLQEFSKPQNDYTNKPPTAETQVTEKQ